MNELWIRKDSLPPRGSQHPSQTVQILRIMECALGVHPACPKSGSALIGVEAHPQESEYLVALFKTDEITEIAQKMFDGMNLGYKITETLEYKPLILKVIWPITGPPSAPSTQKTKILKEERAQSSDAYDLSSTCCYVVDECGGRQQMVIGLDDETFHLIDGSRIPRAESERSSLGIKFLWMRPTQKVQVKRPPPEPQLSEQPQAKKIAIGEEIARVLVEIHGPGNRVRCRFFPRSLTIGEMLKCVSDKTIAEHKYLTVSDIETKHVLSHNLTLACYTGKSHICVIIKPGNLNFGK